MKPISQCLTPDLLHKLAHDELTAAEVASIEDHLDECESCRAVLAQTESDDLWEQQIAPVLRSPATDSVFDSPTDAEEELDRVLRLLGPTDDPYMLGRIGTYEVVGVIGRGGMGIVFKAFDRALNRYVAIKMLLPHLAESGAARKRFAREGQAAAAVVDDHVMPIYSVAEWQGVPYLVMQYSRGTTLQKRVETQGPLELIEILRIGMQTARGLAAAHAQGLVHRDVKPSNIMIDSTVERALLTDFGLARAVDDASITRAGVIAGTPQYMSPEQARAAEIDARSDLFSLGSVLYFLCTARQPFRAESSYAVLRLIIDQEPPNMQETNPDLPAWLCTLVSHLMAKNPGDRPASAQEVAELLQRCLAHVQQPATVPLPASLPIPAVTRVPARRFVASRWIAGAIIAGVALLMALVALPLAFGWFSFRAPRSTDRESSRAVAPADHNLLSVPDIAGLWSVKGQPREQIEIQHDPGHAHTFLVISRSGASETKSLVEWEAARRRYEGSTALPEISGPLRFTIEPSVDITLLQVHFLFSAAQKQQFSQSQSSDGDNVPSADQPLLEAATIERLFENLARQTWLRQSATVRQSADPPSQAALDERAARALKANDEASPFPKFDSGTVGIAALQTWRNYVEWWNISHGTPLITTAEIPRHAWTTPLVQLNPKYIYANGVNLVIVRSLDHEDEEGIYVSLMISSANGPDDAQFTRTLIANSAGGGVYTFRRKGHFERTSPTEPLQNEK